MFISDAAFQFVYPSSFSDSVPAGSLGFGALSDGFYVKDSAGVSSRVLLVKDRRDDVRATGSTDSSLVTEAGIRAAIQAYKPIPDGNEAGQIPYWGSTSWLVSQYMKNVGEFDMLGRLQLSTAWIEGGYKIPADPLESPYTKWGLQPDIAETNIEMIFYDQDSPINAVVNFSIGSVTHNHDYIQAIWDENTDQVSLFLPTLASDGFLKTDSYGMLGVDSSTYEVSLGNPASNGQVLASTTTGTRSWVTLPAAGVNVTNQGDNRVVTSTATTDTLTAESDFLYYDSTAYALLRGEKTATFSIQTSVANAMDYALLSLVRSRGTMSAPTSVVDGDIIGTIAFQGITTSYGTSSPVTITAYAEDTFAFSTRGGSLKIATVPEGSVTSATRFEVTKTGAIRFNNAYTFPTADGTANYILKTNGSGVVSWAAVTSGTVTSVSMTVPTGLTIGGTPITTSGTLALTFTSGYSIPTTANQTNWGTAYTHSQATTGSVHGSTTVGGNLLRLTNVAAIRFIKIAADNTIVTEDASTFRTSIGAGTGNGTVTSVTASGALTSSGGTTPAITVTATYQIPTSAQVTAWNALVSSQWSTVTNGIQYSSNVGVGISPDVDKRFKVSTSLAYVGYFISTKTDGTSYCLSGVSSGANTGATNVGVYASASSGLTNFAFHVDTTTVAGANNWALRVSSVAKNHLEGETGIGIATALGKLQVYNAATSALPGFVVNQLNSSYGLADFQASGVSKVSINYAGQLISTVATTTAPFTIASTTVVTNLNADLLDGNHASDFATSAQASKWTTSTYGITHSGTCIGVGADPASATTTFYGFSATTSANLILNTTQAVGSPLTGNSTIGQVDIRHNGTANYARMLLRYNNDTSAYEFLQQLKTSAATRNFIYVDMSTGNYQMQSGIATVDFQNTGNILISGSGSKLGIGVTSANTTSRITLAAATNAAGGILFGTDTTLYRSAADVLSTDDSFSIDKDQAFYIGTPNATDSWRFILVSKNLEIQYHNGTSYVTKTTIQI